jgi:hypothetical protein
MLILTGSPHVGFNDINSLFKIFLMQRGRLFLFTRVVTTPKSHDSCPKAIFLSQCFSLPIINVIRHAKGVQNKKNKIEL